MLSRSLVVLLALRCWCTGATRCAAPPGWYINGAGPDGWYHFAPVLGRPEDDLLDAQRRRRIAGPPEIPGRLYCTGGATLRQDGRSVWCQR